MMAENKSVMSVLDRIEQTLTHFNNSRENWPEYAVSTIDSLRDLIKELELANRYLEEKVEELRRANSNLVKDLNSFIDDLVENERLS